MRGAAAQAATASGVNQTVRLPRARRPASYSAQLVTRCRCFAMWRRQAALALNGTAEIQASGKEPSSYTAQLPTPTGRSVQQGDAEAGRRQRLEAERRQQFGGAGIPRVWQDQNSGSRMHFPEQAALLSLRAHFLSPTC